MSFAKARLHEVTLGASTITKKNDPNITWDPKRPHQVFRQGKWVDIRDYNNNLK